MVYGATSSCAVRWRGPRGCELTCSEAFSGARSSRSLPRCTARCSLRRLWIRMRSSCSCRTAPPHRSVARECVFVPLCACVRVRASVLV
eukprot:1086573-Rhodomonas_salina.1